MSAPDLPKAAEGEAPAAGWPGRQVRAWSVMFFVLAFCVLVLFPVSHVAGTETSRSRLTTAFLLAMSGVLLRACSCGAARCECRCACERGPWSCACA